MFNLNKYLLSISLIALSFLSSTSANASPSSLTWYCGATYEAHWRPNWGQVRMYERGTRFLGHPYYGTYRKGAILQHFSWDNYNSIDMLNGDRSLTFEPDLRTYDYRKRGWLHIADAKYSYWDSNMPSHYFDTGILDGGEPSFTIGSSAASSFQWGITYYTYMEGYGRLSYSPSNHSYPDTSVKLVYSVGKRWPSSCYSNTWCSYGCKSIGGRAEVFPIRFQDRLTAPTCLTHKYRNGKYSSSRC